MLTPEEIEKYKQLKKDLDAKNEWELQQRIKNRGKRSIQEKWNEYLDLMSYVYKVSPIESEHGLTNRMQHLVEFQNRILTFERRRRAE